MTTFVFNLNKYLKFRVSTKSETIALCFIIFVWYILVLWLQLLWLEQAGFEFVCPWRPLGAGGRDCAILDSSFKTVWCIAATCGKPGGGRIEKPGKRLELDWEKSQKESLPRRAFREVAGARRRSCRSPDASTGRGPCAIFRAVAALAACGFS